MNPGRNTKNALEWTVFGLSLLLVGAAILALSVTAILGKSGPPELSVSTGAPSARSGTTEIPVTVTNTGPTTAAEVRVEIEARFASGESAAVIVIDYVPRGGKREATAVFDGSGTVLSLRPRVVSYATP